MSPDRSALVSVIVPVFNGERYVGEALQSALAQDYPSKEIIVVDDGSTDGTPQALSSFGRQLRVFRQSNAGAAVARNAAIAQARGKYLAFLDADDLWLPHKLTAQIAYLESHPDIGMVYSAWAEWHADAGGSFVAPVSAHSAVELEIEHGGSGWLYNQLLLDCVIHTTTVVIRADIAAQVGSFDESLKRGQDYDYWLRASRITPIHKLRAALSLYRIHAQSITRRPHAANYGYLVIKKALDRGGPVGPDGTRTPARDINKVLAGMWFGYGYAHYQGGDPALARTAFRHCIGYRPFWHSAWIYWLRSWLRRIASPLKSYSPPFSNNK
jgi:glycosyltransferase involved in cell wall biosynthesis